MLPEKPKPSGTPPSAGAVSSPPFKWKHAPTATDPDAIRILGDWALLNIGSFACEETSKWCKRRIITLNYAVKDDFLALWKAWDAAGVLEPFRGLLTWNGGWVARYKRGKPHDQNPRNLSNHSSGHAFDIMAAQYPLGVKPSAVDPIHKLVPIANKHGWEWGGKFNRCDAQHWQHHKSFFP